MPTSRSGTLCLLSLHYARILLGLSLLRSSAYCHNHCELSCCIGEIPFSWCYPSSLALTIFLLSLLNKSTEPLAEECDTHVLYMYGWKLPSLLLSEWWIVECLCVNYHLLQGETSLVRVVTLWSGYSNKSLGVVEILCPLIRIIVGYVNHLITDSLAPITVPGRGSTSWNKH